MLMLTILLLLLLGPHTNPANMRVFESDMVSEINRARESGCTCADQWMAPATQVAWHHQLEISATLHARQMARYRFFEHYSVGGMDIGERARAVGYPWKTIGENLARGQTDIPGVVTAWINSPEHCKVLMNPKFREIGAAHVGEYWVLHLGAR